MWQLLKMHPKCLKWTRQKNKNTHGHRLLFLHIPKKETITVEQIANHIDCETTEKYCVTET